ncbi:MBL fold metallo-hydrolase [Methanocella sp. MCL-LM]|uniref:MBL fold metallo-hydrolase n=1 Tax=Methanocella sp. MCL-LM TaxID=3412035 RepID=UPI003C78373C
MTSVEILEGQKFGVPWVFFVKGEKIAIVDAGNPGRERAILRALGKAGIAREDVSLLILTHGHIDHCGSAGMLKRMLPVPVAAGWPDAEYITRGESAPGEAYGPGDAVQTSRVRYPPVDIDLIARQDTSLKSYGIDGEILVTPGHTPGSISVAVGDSCLIGDLNITYSYKGQPVTSMNPETYLDIRTSIEKVTAGDRRYLYPSHGPRLDARKVREECL